MPPTEFLILWAITWVILAVVFFVAAESIQRYLYESSVERLAWRVMAVTPILAAVLVKWPLPFHELLDHPVRLFAQTILWSVGSWLALRFHWQHAAGAGLIAMITIAPIASSTVDNVHRRFLQKTPAEAVVPATDWINVLVVDTTAGVDSTLRA